MIYLDNAATTLHKPPQVGQAMLTALGSLGNSARGVHAGSLDAARVIYAAREKLAALFHCPRPDHVVFTANITQALNTAIYGLLLPGDHVITTDLEHNSVLRPLYRLERERGISVDYVPADLQGNVNLSDFEQRIRPNTRVIVCTHASNLTGNLTDLAAVSRIAHAHGLLLVADCAQTGGAMPVDMEALGVDVLCFTGHKGLMGPQGTGGLCIRPGVELRPLLVGGTGVQTYSLTQPGQYPVRLEAGTLNGPGIAGLGAAVDFLLETGPDRIHARETALMNRFYEGVRTLPEITVYGDFTRDRAPIVTLNLADWDSGELADALFRDYDIAVRAGAHCAPRMHAALGTKEQGAVRFSFSYFNTESEIDAALSALTELTQE